MRYYAVFDTNVLISSLLTKKTDTATAKVIDAIASGVISPLYNQAILIVTPAEMMKIITGEK